MEMTRTTLTLEKWMDGTTDGWMDGRGKGVGVRRGWREKEEEREVQQKNIDD